MHNDDTVSANYKDAIDNGCRHFIVGNGAPQTMVVSMLQALGYDFQIKTVPCWLRRMGLQSIAFILYWAKCSSRVEDCTFRVACDVNESALWSNGIKCHDGPAAKGATPGQWRTHESASHYAELSKETFDHADRLTQVRVTEEWDLRFSLIQNAVLESGIKIVLEETGLEDEMKDADFVITGEGRLDSQTALWKSSNRRGSSEEKHVQEKVLAFADCLHQTLGYVTKRNRCLFLILRRVTVQ